MSFQLHLAAILLMTMSKINGSFTLKINKINSAVI